jgi:hypothetical protein
MDAERIFKEFVENLEADINVDAERLSEEEKRKAGISNRALIDARFYGERRHEQRVVIYNVAIGFLAKILDQEPVELKPKYGSGAQNA